LPPEFPLSLCGEHLPLQDAPRETGPVGPVLPHLEKKLVADESV